MHRIRYLLGSLTLLAAVVGAFWLVQILQSADQRPGVQLAVEFRDARGLRAGADVRFRGVNIGTVRAVEVAADGGKAVANLLLDPAGAAQACVNSSFWIVTPRFAITGGASGLDTLVRDSYVAFHTPQERGSPLVAGSRLVGRERPPANLEPEALEDLELGDLLMTLLVPENHGLKVGSPVVFRGMQTGDVRAVELASSGSHVEVQLRIARRHRQTVTEESKFWVARPALTGALFSGFTVTDGNALLSPYVSYHTVTGRGVPIADGHRAAAEPSRPELEAERVPAGSLRVPTPAAAAPEPGLVLVRVVYSALERDTWSPDDPIQREGTGVLLLDRSGRAVVVTARSLVDGAYTERDTFGGSPDIADEKCQVMLASGTVLRAVRAWVDSGGHDLAALLLDGVPPGLLGTPADRLGFTAETLPGPVELRPVGPDALPIAAMEASIDELGRVAAHLVAQRGAALLAGNRVLGVVGLADGQSSTGVMVPLRLLPDDLRPE